MTAILNTLLNLRTVRRNNFSAKPISDQDIAEILQVSVKAANASNRQGYSIIVVEDSIKQELGWPGSRVLLYCVDYVRLKDSAAYLKKEFDCTHLQPLVTGIIDTALAAQTAVIAAKAKGIDSLITNDVYTNTKTLDKIKRLLELPEEYCFPLLLVCLGYPEKEPEHRKGRLTGHGVIHYGKYKRCSAEEIQEIVEAYNDTETHLSIITNWGELGYAHYLDWFFDKWIIPLENPRKSEELTAILERYRLLKGLS